MSYGRSCRTWVARTLKRRSAIEPEIGHMKNDGHLGRCYLKGRQGDAMNVLLVACGHNLRKILAWLRSFFAWILGWLRVRSADQPLLSHASALSMA